MMPTLSLTPKMILGLAVALALALGCAVDEEGTGNGTDGTTGESGSSQSADGGGFSGDGSGGPCMPGTETCSCYQGECFGCLVCASDLCVDLGGCPSDESGGTSTSGTDGGEATSASTTSTTSTTAASDTGTSCDPGTQPQNGAMYADCLQPAQCMSGWCQTFFNQMGVTYDGYCSAYPCANPITDCAPAPGDCASPICIYNPNGGFTECALDCSQGPCPEPMTCNVYQNGTAICS